MKTWVYFADLLGSKYGSFAPIVGDLLCLFTGMSIAWSSPVLIKLKGTDDNPLGTPITSDENDWIGSVFSIGGAVGPLILIYSLELLGRKATMLILATIFPVFHLILAFATNIYVIYACRIACGIAVGGSFSIVAVYVSEIVSAKMRGTYLSLGTSFILTGCLVSYSIGPYVSIRIFNLIIAAASFIYIPIFLFICPETLYYTMQKHGPGETAFLLRKLRNTDSIDVELDEIENAVGTKETGSFLDLFREKAASRAFCICTTLLIIQQFCGVNVIMTYAQKIFKDAKVQMGSDVCTIVVSAFQTGTCLITPFASKRFNRKLMLTFAFIGVSLSNIFLGLYFSVDAINGQNWVPLASLISFVTFYNCGVGPLPWATLGELYPQNVKSVGTATSNTIYWVIQFLLTFYFNKMSEGVAFLVFGGLCLVGAVFVQIFLVETRGKTLQEIQREMKK